MYSMITDARILGLITERKAADEARFYVDPEVAGRFGDFEIIVKKKRLGLRKGGDILLPPLFDFLEFMADSAVKVRLDGRLGVFDISRCRFISDFKYDEVECHGGVLLLLHPRGKDIFSLTLGRMLVNDGAYDEYNLKDESTRYMWARRGRFFDYVSRESGRVVSLPGVVMAYDTEEGMYGLFEHGGVFFYTPEGNASASELRRIVRSLGGYLTLRNHTLHIEHTVDVYGNILNL